MTRSNSLLCCIIETFAYTVKYYAQWPNETWQDVVGGEFEYYLRARR